MIKKILSFSVPPSYRCSLSIKSHGLDDFAGFIHAILTDGPARMAFLVARG